VCELGLIHSIQQSQPKPINHSDSCSLSTGQTPVTGPETFPGKTHRIMHTVVLLYAINSALCCQLKCGRELRIPGPSFTQINKSQLGRKTVGLLSNFLFNCRRRNMLSQSSSRYSKFWSTVLLVQMAQYLVTRIRKVGTAGQNV
jgi:hypothetical protein